MRNQAIMKVAWQNVAALATIARQVVASAVSVHARLPPGDIGRSSFARFGDHRYYLRQFQRHGPIFRVVWSQRLTICIVGFARAKRLFALHARALFPLTVDITPSVPHGALRAMEREAHSHYRRIFVAALRDDLAVAWEPELRRIIRTELGALAALASTRCSIGVPVLAATMERLATRGLLVLFFGLKPGHPTYQDLERAYERLGPAEFPSGRFSPSQQEAFAALTALAWRAVDAFKDAPAWADGDCVLGRLVRQHPTAIDDTVVGNLVHMLEQGRYDLRGLLVWILRHLSASPDIAGDLRNQLDRDGPVAQDGQRHAEGVVLETLRLDQAEFFNREVREDFIFEGHRVPRGSFLRVLVRESHQNASVFPEPERFKPCRFAGRSYTSDEFAPFGVGEHRCLGGPIVVRLSTLLVEELVTGFVWPFHPDDDRVFRGYHWEPPPSFEFPLMVREPDGNRALRL